MRHNSGHQLIAVYTIKKSRLYRLLVQKQQAYRDQQRQLSMLADKRQKILVAKQSIRQCHHGSKRFYADELITCINSLKENDFELDAMEQQEQVIGKEVQQLNIAISVLQKKIAKLEKKADIIQKL